MQPSTNRTIDYGTPGTRQRPNVIRIAKYIVASAMLACAIYLVVAFIVAFALTRAQYIPVATADSPDGRYRATWTQVQRLIDFNFELRIDDLRDSAPARKMFISPDERPDDGRSQLIWSTDSSRLLVVASSVFADEQNLSLLNGQPLYLLFDTRTDAIQCNASRSNHPRIIESDVAGFSVQLGSPAASQPATSCSPGYGKREK